RPCIVVSYPHTVRCNDHLLSLCPLRPPPYSSLFPYTTLFRSPLAPPLVRARASQPVALRGVRVRRRGGLRHALLLVRASLRGPGDRKSTRLNSSHDQISYAVF